MQRIQVISGVATVFANGVEQLSYTDGAPLTGGFGIGASWADAPSSASPVTGVCIICSPAHGAPARKGG